MTHKFDQSLKRGEVGERVLDKLLEQRGYRLRLASPAEQRRGIDRHCFNPRTRARVTLEYKTDERASQTGNAFIETVSVDRTDRPGWAYTSEADYLVYFLPADDLVYIMTFKALRRQLECWKQHYREVVVQNEDYCTHGLLVPLGEFEQHAEGVLSG